MTLFVVFDNKADFDFDNTVKNIILEQCIMAT